MHHYVGESPLVLSVTNPQPNCGQCYQVYGHTESHGFKWWKFFALSLNFLHLSRFETKQLVHNLQSRPICDGKRLNYILRNSLKMLKKTAVMPPDYCSLMANRGKCLGFNPALHLLHVLPAPLWGFRGYGQQNKGKHLGRNSSPPFIPCNVLFMFLCQVSITLSSLALAYNILFKQVCRLKFQPRTQSNQHLIGYFGTDKIPAEVGLYLLSNFFLFRLYFSQEWSPIKAKLLLK